MRNSIARSLVAAALALVLSVVIAGPAAAAPIDSAPSQVNSLCSTTRALDVQYLPVERWSGATQKIHVRSNGGIADFAPVQRQLQSMNFVVGDFMYGLTTKFVTWSTQFCPLQAVGGAVDSAAAQLGRALVNSSLVAGLLVCTLIVLLLQGFRNRDSGWLGRLGIKLLVVALFAIMVAGSTQSRGGGIGGDFDTPYQPGRGSPGWFATTIDRVVTELAAAPAAALSAQTIVDTVGSGDQLDCAPYLGALQDGYTAQASRGGVISSEAVPALTVSNLWQISGYNAWSVGQFGNKNLNGQSRVACRMLDRNAAIPVDVGSFVIDGAGAAGNRSAASVTDVMSRVPQPDVGLVTAKAWVRADAPAWRQLSGVEADKGWIAWATCVPRDGQLSNVTSRTGWKAPDGNAWLIADDAARAGADRVDGSAKLNQACWSFFNRSGDTVDPIFDWGDGDKQLRAHADEMPASVYDFISALHGTNQTAGGVASIGYVGSALGVMVIFGGLGLAILVVKIITLVMLFSVFFCMAAVLLPNADNSKLVRFTKEYIGLTLFTAFAVFILAMIILFVKIIWLLLGAFTGGPNSLMTMLLGGLAPVLAAIALHRAFTSIGMPSPMTVNGAVGWGQAMAGGAATGAVVSGMNRMTGGARGLAAVGGRKLGTAAFGGMKSKLGLGRTGRDGTPSALQKSEITTPGVIESAVAESPRQTPETVLQDPTASPAAKRAAQRQRAADLAGLKAEEQQERRAARESAQPEAARSEAGPSEPARPEVHQLVQADEGARGLGDRIAAGAATTGAAAKAQWAATRTAVDDKRLDAQRLATEAVTHPVEASRRAARKAPKAALGTAAVVGAATVGGLPGVAVVGGVVAAKKTTEAVRRRHRARSEDRQRRLDAFRERRAGQDADTTGRPGPGAGSASNGWADAVSEPGPFERPSDPGFGDRRG